MTITIVALGVATAAAYGACDYFGGLASRRSGSALAVVAMFHLVALALFAAALPLAAGGPDAASLGWGAAAGVAGGVAYIRYFRALAVGRMAVVATVTAVWSAVVPVVAGLALGERPTPLAWTGIAAVFIAIVLITSRIGGPAAGSTRRLAAGVGAATFAGIAFGGFFIALDRASAAPVSVAWPLFAATASGAVIVGAAALAQRIDWHGAWQQAPLVATAGTLHAAGTWALIVAVGQGWVSLVAVIAALSPAATMLLARLLLTERLTVAQLAGTPLALLGVGLITAGMP